MVVGLGEIGLPIFKIISQATPTEGHDIKKKYDKKQYHKFPKYETSILHVCIPFTNKFERNILNTVSKFQPSGIVIHSTIRPGTTEKLQKKLKIPVIYSATRGMHRQMIKDLRRYTKFFAIYNWAPKHRWAQRKFANIMRNSGIKIKKMSNPLTLELAKIVCDTSYYGWLINYAQISNMIAIQNKIDYDEMWSFADEIHKFLGNRPKMFPGFIGGHCVVQNLKLIDKEDLRQIDKINNLYAKKVKNAKSIAKKYVKGRQSSDTV